VDFKGEFRLGNGQYCYPPTATWVIAAGGRICLHRKRVNLSHVLAGQRLGIVVTLVASPALDSL